jgi:transposase-like protein
LSGLRGRIKQFVPLRDLYDYVTRCIYCGSTEIISKGWRKYRQQREVRRYKCKKCGRRFIRYSILHEFSEEVVEDVLDLAVCGASLRYISERVSAKRLKRVSAKQVRRIIHYIVDVLNRYDELLKEQSSEIEVDEMFQKLSANKKAWEINVLARNSRRWLSSFVACDRSFESSLKAVSAGIKKLKSPPVGLKCDGHQPYVQVATVLGIEIDSKSKSEDFAHVNLIERMHGTARGYGLRKKKSFGSIAHLQILVDIVRHYYNFLRPHEALSGKTPVEADVGLRVGRWSSLINLAEKHATSNWNRNQAGSGKGFKTLDDFS